jgi:ribosomal protein S18 acetylase RimI-like enzyme
MNLSISNTFVYMESILNNPIWSSLHVQQDEMAEGNDDVRFFKPDVGPLVGLRENTPENFKLLFDFLEDGRVAILFSPEADLNPSPLKTTVKMPGYQMVFEGQIPDVEGNYLITSLNTSDIPEMLALTELAQPGPFSKRTIEFGNYRGIYKEGKLVAMAGNRLQSRSTTEISAVCTHPDHAGQGYARMLIEDQVKIIQRQGKVAYLHVRSDNVRAVELYRHIGFRVRTDMYFYIMRR